MPACRLCGERIDVSRTGVRGHRCTGCGKIVCRAHFDPASMTCNGCRGLPAHPRRRSFLRTPEA